MLSDAPCPEVGDGAWAESPIKTIGPLCQRLSLGIVWSGVRSASSGVRE
jgi:hypothetical protein